MFPKWPAFAAASMVLFIACGSQHMKPVEDLSGKHNASDFALTY